MTHSAHRTLVKAATIIMLGNIASRLLGLGREQVIAALFGGGGVTDAFTAASTLPTLIYDFLIGGAISAALVPIFSDYADELPPQSALAHLAATLLTLVALVLGIAILVLIWLAPQLMAWLGAGLTLEQRAQAVSLTRLMLPATWFLATSGILTALLHAQRQFARPAFVTAIYNLSIIIVALLLAERLGVNSLAIGVIVGAFLQVMLQWPAARALHLRPTLDLAHPALRRALALYAPVAAGIIISSLGVFIDRRLASQAGEGSLSAMRYATTIIQFPIGLVAVALSAAILPTLSRQATVQTDAPTHDEYKTTLALGIKLAMLAMIPAMVAMMALSEPLVRLLFERGAFKGGDSARTALAFLAYAPQLPFVALDQLLLVAFYARKNTLLPNLVAAGSLGFYLVTALGLFEAWGMVGLAFANAVQNSSHALIMLVLLWPRVGGLLGYGIGRTTLKVCIASAPMGFIIWLSERGVMGWLGNPLFSVAAAATIGGCVYVALLLALGVSEAQVLLALVRARLGKAVS